MAIWMYPARSSCGSVCALTEEQRAAAERLAGAGALRRTSAAAARMRGRRRGRKSACACSPGSVSRMTRLPGTARDGCPDAGTGKGKCPGGGTFRGGGKRTNFMPARCRHDVSIRSRPVDWLKRPTDRGRADCPFPQREVAEKGFHRLRRRVSRAVPPEGGGLKPQGNF